LVILIFHHMFQNKMFAVISGRWPGYASLAALASFIFACVSSLFIYEGLKRSRWLGPLYLPSRPRPL
jgi:hypothetical protein